MVKFISKAVIVAFSVIFVSCASSYRPINPGSFNYPSSGKSDSIDFSYRYNVLTESGNKKYAKKEIKRSIQLVSVKITNNTSHSFTIGKDVSFYSGDYKVTPLSPSATKDVLMQIVPGYLPYALFCFTKITYTENENGMVTKQESYPVGLILGPALTIGNMVMAGASNKKLLAELKAHNVIDREVKSGETVYGLIGIRNGGYTNLTLK